MTHKELKKVLFLKRKPRNAAQYPKKIDLHIFFLPKMFNFILFHLIF